MSRTTRSQILAILVTLAFSLTGLVNPSHANSVTPTRLLARPPLEDAVAMRWSDPIGTASDELIAWQRHNARQLSEVETAWAAMLRRMRGHRPARFDHQCRALTSSLESVDESILLPVPDPLVDLYVRRLMKHLHGATTACGTGQLFNVVYRLEEARAALGEIRWLLTQRTVKSP